MPLDLDVVVEAVSRPEIFFSPTNAPRLLHMMRQLAGTSQSKLDIRIPLNAD